MNGSAARLRSDGERRRAPLPLPLCASGARNEASTSAGTAAVRRRKARIDPRGERQRPFVIAIDGPAASGKGTLARRLAERFGLAHLDTGASTARRRSSSLTAAAIRPIRAAAGGRRSPRASRRSAVGSAAARRGCRPARPRWSRPIPAVRAALLDFQRDFAAASAGAGAGRGARRPRHRHGGLPRRRRQALRHRRRPKRAPGAGSRSCGQAAPRLYTSDVLQDMKERDARDAGRSAAPLGSAARCAL